MDKKTCDYFDKRVRAFRSLEDEKEAIVELITYIRKYGVSVVGVGNDYKCVPKKAQESVSKNMISVLEQRFSEIEKEQGEM